MLNAWRDDRGTQGCEQVDDRLDRIAAKRLEDIAPAVLSEEDLHGAGVLGDEPDHCGERAPELAIQGFFGVLGHCPDDDGQDLVAHLLRDRDEKGVAVGEILVEVAIGESGARAYAAHRDGRPTVLTPQVASGLQKGSASLRTTLLGRLSAVLSLCDTRHVSDIDSKPPQRQSVGMRLQNWQPPGLSLRSRVIMDVLGATWRPLTHVMPPGRIGAVTSRRLIAAGLILASPPVNGATFDRIEAVVADGLTLRGEWVRTPRATRSDGVVLYIHGSGYMVCSSRTHRGLTSQIADRTGLPVLSVDYRLFPSHRYPAAPQDVRAAWNWLLAEGHDPARIVVAGDSAGGHLALTLVLDLVRTGQALPAALVTLSPLVDLRVERGLVRDRIERDPFASAAVARRTLARYADAEAMLDDGLRIEFDDIDRFPPTLVHAGSREMLAADCTDLVRRLKGAGLEVEYRVWPGLMHVFQAMTALMPESPVALDEIATFITTHLSAADAAPYLMTAEIA